MFEKAEKVKRWFKVGLWGGPKTGKSVLALSFPSSVVIDTHRGSLVYSDRFQFDFKDVNHWRELAGPLDWLEKNPGKYQTVIIDDITVLYKDLIDEVTQAAFNRSNREILTDFDWGVIKRRWASLENRLIDLDANIVTVVREKDEYRESENNGKREKSKTGDQIQDIPKTLSYTFDFIIRLRKEVDKKGKKERYIATVDGTRRDELKNFTEFDITGKRGYDVIFKPLEAVMLTGKPASKLTAPPQEPALLVGEVKQPDPKPAAPPEAQKGPAAIGAIVDLGEKMISPGSQIDGEPATLGDLKVLFTRVGEMRWPDGSPISSAQAKRIVKEFFGVESSKELRKHQVDFLYREFGDVLAGRSVLALDGEVPYVKRLEPAAVAGQK